MGNCSTTEPTPAMSRRMSTPVASHEERRLKLQAQSLAAPPASAGRSQVRVVPDPPVKKVKSSSAASPPGSGRDKSFASKSESLQSMLAGTRDSSFRSIARAASSRSSTSTATASPRMFSPTEAQSPTRTYSKRKLNIRDNSSYAASNDSKEGKEGKESKEASRERSVTTLTARTPKSPSPSADEQFSFGSDSEPEMDTLNTTQYATVKGVGDTYRPDSGEKWEGRPTKIPANLPKDHNEWVPFRHYSHVPPLCHYTVRNGVFWVALEDNALGKSTKSITPLSDEDLASPSPPCTPLLTNSQLAGSLRSRTTRSFSQLYSNVSAERLQKEQLCLPAVPKATPPLGYCYYYVRENIPKGADECDVFKTGFGLWLRCSSATAKRNHEEWFAGRTETTADLLGIAKVNASLPGKIPKLAGFLWVPYKAGVADLPFLKDTVVTAGVFRGEGDVIWQSYHHTCLPDAEHAFGTIPEVEERSGSPGKADVQKVARQALDGNLSSGRQLASAGKDVNPPGWSSGTELPKPPRNLPKLNERSLKLPALVGKPLFWYPCLLESLLPYECITVATRQRGGCVMYWAALREEVAAKVRYGKTFKVETRSWAQLYSVTQRDVPADLPRLQSPNDGWVLYRNTDDIPPEVLRHARSQLVSIANGDYWLSLPKAAADAIGEVMFKPEAGAAKHHCLRITGTADVRSVADVEAAVQKLKAAGTFYEQQASRTEPSPFATAAVEAVAEVVQNVHRINGDSVWVPYHQSETIVDRYTTFPQLGGHIFNRGFINWVVYRVENAPKGRKCFQGRTQAYSEIYGLKNVTYLPHCDPELMGESTAWVPFPELEAIPPEVIVLRNFDYTDKHEKNSRLFHWRLLKKNFGEGFVPSLTSFMDALGITRAPYGLPRATRGDFWVPYPSVEQITDGLEDCPKVLLQGVVWVLVEKVPAPEKGLPALRLPEIPKRLRDQWPYDAEVDAILRRHLTNTCLLKMVARAKKQGLPKLNLLKLMHHVLSVKDDAVLEDIENRILDETGHQSRVAPGQQRDSWMTQILKVSGSNALTKEDDDIAPEATEALKRFMARNEEEIRKESLASGTPPNSVQGIADDFIALQRLLSRRYSYQLPTPPGKERVFSGTDSALPPPGEIVTRKVLRSLLYRVIKIPDEAQRRVLIMYLITEAVFMSYYFRVNYSQQLALICMTSLETWGEGGGIGEMKTGEGKSVTIAMAAAYHALNERKVDIMTSSEILARRDAGKTRAFYALLGLTVTHNCPCKGEGEEDPAPSEGEAGSPRKKRAPAYNPEEKIAAYKADIVYGTVPEFQFTFIRDVYLNHNERGERGYDIAIIDEVDNMLIDSSGRCSRLSSTIPGMDQIHWVYYLIHARLSEWSSPDLDAVHSQVLAHPLVKDLYPDTLKEMVKQNLKQWVHSCFKTRTFQANREYVVKNNEVVNVDNANTGVLQYGTVLSNGVHQFLQVKEGVPVSDETATGGFSSVLAFFQLYKKKTGLTGTIGEDEEKSEFRACYALQFFQILPFHEAKRAEEMEVMPHKDQLKDALLKVANEQAIGRRRPILVIAESIGESNEFSDHLKDCVEADGDCTLQRYTGVQSKKEEHVLRDAGNPGVITVATNLAGRGMDIVTTPEAEENGGLYVVCCFLPINMRVELQAAGRTGRQGKRGTFHLLCASTSLTVDQLKLRRKQQNEMKTQHKLAVTIPVAQHTAQLFSDFCGQKDVHIEKVKHLLPFNAKYEKRALKERWIAFMQQYHSRYQAVRSVHDARAFMDEQDAKFRAFRDSVVRDLTNRTAVRNPLQYARRAAQFIEEERYVMARQDLQRAATLPGGAEHPTVQLLLGFVASKGIAMSGGTGRGYGAAAVARHLAAACEGYRKWLDYVVQGKRVFPRCTRMLVVEGALAQVVVSLAETLRGLDKWLADTEGVPLKALLDFVPNPSRVHTEEKAPDTCGNNTVRLKRLGIVGNVLCRVHQAKLATMREALFDDREVQLIPLSPRKDEDD